jgi:hypothetical protein
MHAPPPSSPTSKAAFASASASFSAGGGPGRLLLGTAAASVAGLEVGFTNAAKSGDHSGCCATVVLCKGGTLACANLGDCRGNEIG